MKKIAGFLFLLGVLSAFTFLQADPYTFEGKVTDEAGNPLIRASVLIKDSRRGTFTDVNGAFTLEADQPELTLVISYVGYQVEEVEAQSAKFCSVQLKPTSGQLEEVVITGYGQTKRSRIASDGAMLRAAAPAAAQYYDAVPENEPQYNTEDYARIDENRFHAVRQKPLSTFSIDVDAASYSNIRRFINQGARPPKDAVRIEEMVNYFNYDYPEPQGDHPFTVTTEISECPWRPRHQLLQVGLQGKHIDNENLPASNLVFLLDVSGSMNAPNKLPLLKSSFKLLVNQLRPQDRVAIVVYAGAAGTVLPSTSGADKQAILDALEQLSAGGSTAGSAGIEQAYAIAERHFVKGGNNRVILATDGDFNVGVSSDAALTRIIEKKRKSGVFLTVLGFGRGNYKDNKMQQLADHGNGNHAYIDNIKEAKKVLVREFGATVFTIAKDVKLQLEFNPAKVQGYRLIGYENRLLEAEDFKDDQKDAGELGAGHTVTALYEIIPAGLNTDWLADVDELKYQKQETDPFAARTGEWLTVKLRYKQPDGDKSRLLEEAVTSAQKSMTASSDNFRWAAAVAEFGLLLRDSEYKGEATYRHCKELAHGARGRDAHAYRQELTDMLDTMIALEEPEVASKKD